MPQLLAILDQALALKWHQRRHALRGLREAFKRMGPDAAIAIPRIKSLMSERPSPLCNSASDRDEWLAALCRMGVVPKQLPFGGRVRNEADRERRIERVRNQVRRYEAQM